MATSESAARSTGFIVGAAVAGIVIGVLLELADPATADPAAGRPGPEPDGSMAVSGPGRPGGDVRG